jgi:hypothetical protein
MQELFDRGSFSGSIGSGETVSIRIDSQRAERLVVLVDSGTTDSVPAQYTLRQRAFTGAQDRLQLYNQVSSTQGVAYTDVPYGQETEIEIENTSGASAEYDVSVLAYLSES